MNAIAFLQASTDFAHRTYERTIAGLTAAHANQPPLGLARTVGSAMAHVVVVEDALVQATLRGASPLHASEFAGRTGISDPQMFNTEKWRSSVKVEPEPLHSYAAAVFEATTDTWPGRRKLTSTSLGTCPQPGLERRRSVGCSPTW